MGPILWLIWSFRDEGSQADASGQALYCRKQPRDVSCKYGTQMGDPSDIL